MRQTNSRLSKERPKLPAEERKAIRDLQGIAENLSRDAK